MPYSDSELELLLKEVESDRSERKESFKGDAPTTARQAVCAFANDLPDHRQEGVLFIGVDDSGTPTGLPITDSLLQSLADIKTDGRILPPPSITVEKRLLFGVEVAVLHVKPSTSPPVRFDGRCWTRIGPRRALATLVEERVLHERRRFGSQPFDLWERERANLTELDENYFRAVYLPASVPADILAQNGRSYVEQLASAKFVVPTEPFRPTNCGMLVAGQTPRDHFAGSYVQFLRIDGVSASDPITDAAEISGKLGEIIDRTEDKFRSHNRLAVDFLSGPLEKRTYDYPEAAFQQLFRNAVMHRTYEVTNAPVRVYWYNDRIEIMNPGGPFGAAAGPGSSFSGLSDYRNPNIAEALKNLGYVQRFGLGIVLAQDALSKNGNPPIHFDATSAYFSCTMSRVKAS